MNKNFPLTTEQENCYKLITADIDKVIQTISSEEEIIEGKFHFIQGKAGVGKTQFAKKLIEYCWDNDGIAIGCAATALAATIYSEYDFETTHSLFKIPVDTDNDKDEDEFNCQLDNGKHQERNELLKATSLIIWDECCSNHVKIFQSILQTNFGFKNTVVVCLGSYEQMLPIITNNPTKTDILNSCLCMFSENWNIFSKHVFTKNLRLNENTILIEGKNAKEEFEIFIDALSCNKVIENNSNIFGESNILFKKPTLNENGYEISEEMTNDIEYYIIKNLKIFNSNEFSLMDKNLISDTDNINKNVQQTLNFLYPDGFENSDRINSYVVAVTNNQIYFWNNEIQKLNKNKAITLFSTNKFADIDDPYNNLMELFKIENVNERIVNHDVPIHNLTLKVDDICLLCVNYSRRIGLTKNRKVIIKDIQHHRIGIIIADDVNKVDSQIIWIPKIRFRFRMNHGKSFAILRTQFPLRLAYCLTYNRSQGQSCDRLILDTTYPPFAHGHFYVAMTRCREFNNIGLFSNEEQLIRNDNDEIIGVNLPNIMHKEVLQEYNIL